MTLLGLSSSLDKNGLGCHRPWTKMTLLCHRPWTKMTLLGLSSSMDKNDSAWVVIVPGQK